MRSSVFDTFTGLPVHVLVIHLVVVLLPLMSVATPAIAIRPRWRHLLPWAVVGNVVAVLATFTATQSGEKLEDRIRKAQNGVGMAAIERHADKGEWLPWFALALLVVSILAYLAVRIGSSLLPVVMVLAVVMGAVTIYQTVVTGDAGARAAWGDLIKNASSSGS